ncbi:MAG TPA: radical SAM protein [Thermoanaerobaculia bacterium]|nr:radical SAM protein [Thermoanaerobaculia bacterium]
MRIHNVRLGFATNSSSTHSIIFLKPGQRPEDTAHGGEFGWDFWTAASGASKRQYVALHLYDALRSQLSAEVALAVTQSWVKDFERTPEGDYSYNGGGPAGYVDHQSAYILPQSWDGKGVDKAFFDEFMSFFMRDDVAILGGNDNTDESHPLDSGGFVLPLERDGRAEFVARKDDKQNYWTLFDRGSGSKIRFSFEEPSSRREVTKASAPELVDLKITDFCPYGCAFCYQGSTHAGKHGDAQAIAGAAYALGKMKVFEVAIGGGEPTMHPKFVEILETFRRQGIVPNFTTKNLAWLRDASVWTKVCKLIGGFAYSVDKAEDVKKLAALLESNGIERSLASVQYVMGSSHLYALGEIVRACAAANLRLTLLGYKTTGRGSSFKPEKYDGWLDMIEKTRKDGVYVNIGIDTALAKESEGALDGAGICRRLYATREGAFSMYLDAVEMKVGPSSYVDDLAMRRVKQFDEGTILEAFSGYGAS